VKLEVLTKENKLKLFSKSVEVGEYQSEINCKAQGEKLKITFNYKFLLDGLINVKKPEVEIYFNGQNQPALIKPQKQEDYQYIVMPIKEV